MTPQIKNKENKELHRPPEDPSVADDKGGVTPESQVDQDAAAKAVKAAALYAAAQAADQEKRAGAAKVAKEANLAAVTTAANEAKNARDTALAELRKVLDASKRAEAVTFATAVRTAADTASQQAVYAAGIASRAEDSDVDDYAVAAKDASDAAEKAAQSAEKLAALKPVKAPAP